MLQVAEMLEHPLRAELTQEDHQRLDKLIKGDTSVPVTREEIEALNDIMYDYMVAKLQTHPGSIVLQ